MYSVFTDQRQHKHVVELWPLTRSMYDTDTIYREICVKYAWVYDTLPMHKYALFWVLDFGLHVEDDSELCIVYMCVISRPACVSGVCV